VPSPTSEQVLDGIEFPRSCLFTDLTHAVHNKNLKKKQITDLGKGLKKRSFFRERACKEQLSVYLQKSIESFNFRPFLGTCLRRRMIKSNIF